jgi:hypothetical protein
MLEGISVIEREIATRNFMVNQFIPALHSILEEGNPIEYKKWGGNACRQTAIFGVKFLEKLLPTYNWEAWDGTFDDIVMGRAVKYNHAWIYGEEKSTGKKLLVDLSRNFHERLFLFVDVNDYPRDNPTYKDMIEINRKKLNVKEAMKDLEYYTGLRSPKLLQILQEKTQLENFRKELKKNGI